MSCSSIENIPPISHGRRAAHTGDTSEDPVHLGKIRQFCGLDYLLEVLRTARPNDGNIDNRAC